MRVDWLSVRRCRTTIPCGLSGCWIGGKLAGISLLRLLSGRVASSGLIGIASQLIAIVGGFLPLFLGSESAFVYVLIVSSVSAACVGFATLAVAFRLPVAVRAQDFGRHSGRPSPDSFESIVSSSISFMLCLSIALMVAGSALLLSGVEFGVYFAGSGVVLLGQGSFLIVQSVAVSLDSYPVAMRARLVYSVLVLSLTALACLSDDSLVYAVAVGLSYLVAAISGGWMLRDNECMKITRMWSGFVTMWRCFLFDRYLILSQLLSAVAMQSGGLSAGLVGNSAAAWAVANRVSGGLQTTGGQVLSPWIDARVSRGIREARADTVRFGLRVGVVGGVLLGAATVAGTWLIAYFSDVPGLSGSSAYWFAVVFFCSFQVATVPIERSLTFLGGKSFRVLWSAARCAVVVPLLVFVRGDVLLAALAVVGGVSATAYFAGLLYYYRRWSAVTSLPEVGQLGSNADVGTRR